ncbi:MAG: hypothetical protein AB7S37_01550 [Methanobacteriales archaeon]|nr:hypothetical protein [Methanobacteriales archaeon]HOQ19966.1 hypothetical protein [Methanothermobacter sp.]
MIKVDQKMLIVGVGALLIGLVIGWTLGLSSTQNPILNITNNSSDQPADEPTITQPTQQQQPTQQYPGNDTSTPSPDQPSPDGTSPGNTSRS